MIAIKINNKIKYVTPNEYHGMVERGEIQPKKKNVITGMKTKAKKHNKK